MRLFLLTALTMLAFAANSVLNRWAVGPGHIGAVEFACVRVVAGAVMLAVLVLWQRGGLAWPGRRGRAGGVLGLSVYLIGFSLAYRGLDAGTGALVFGVATLLLSYLVQPKYPEPEKLTTYECGSEPFSDARMPFPVRYYIFAMLFVIFDIEVIFLYPWAVVFTKIELIGLIEMLVFIGLFLVAYVYAWRKGALEWD